MASASLIMIGHAAFHADLEQYPGASLTLRQGTRHPEVAGVKSWPKSMANSLEKPASRALDNVICTSLGNVICGRRRLARVLLSVCASRSGAVICSAFDAALYGRWP